MEDSRTDIEAALRDDPAALDALLTRHLPGLRAYVRLRIGRAVAVKVGESDIVQSACLEVLRDLDGFEYRGEGAFRRWLYGAALHKILQRERGLRAARRDVGREYEVDPREIGDLAGAYASICTPSRVAMGREDLSRVDAAFARLSEEHREVILMARVLGLSHREIAADLGRSEGAVRVLLHRALARLAVLLGGSGKTP